MKSAPIDLVRDLLDRQLCDAEDMPCGMVDDVELDDATGVLRVVGLMVGAGAWVPRMPALLQRPASKLFGSRIVRVPWAQIDSIREHVRLKSTAAELGLEFRSPHLQRWIERIPGHENKSKPD